MEPGFSPLDERLGLLAGSHLTPSLIEGIVRLGTHVPFAQVPPLMAHFTGVTVSAATVRRLTQAAGAVQVEIETDAVTRIERELPAAPAGPDVQHLSVDGAFVRLVGGTWAEVKTLCLGTVVQRPAARTERCAARELSTPRTLELSYFSRLTDSETFGRLATVETHRRGTETARTVVAVVDGAAWCQGFIDLHRPDAVRILDFPHAVSYLASVAQALCPADAAAASQWLREQTAALRDGREATVIATLAHVCATTVAGDVQALVQTAHDYLAARRQQLRYQLFTTAGYPIASGCVESANKLVVEARLKGSGMHWARAHVDPMLALRTVTCNARWDEAWTTLWAQWRCGAREQTRQRRSTRRPALPVPAAPVLPATTAAAVARAPRPKTIVDGKPTGDHPWRRSSPIAAKR